MIKIEFIEQAFLDAIPETVLDSIDPSDVLIAVHECDRDIDLVYPIVIRWDISLDEFEKNVKKLISVAQHPMGKMFLSAINKIIKP